VGFSPRITGPKNEWALALGLSLMDREGPGLKPDI